MTRGKPLPPLSDTKLVETLKARLRLRVEFCADNGVNLATMNGQTVSTTLSESECNGRTPAELRLLLDKLHGFPFTVKKHTFTVLEVSDRDMAWGAVAVTLQA